MYRAKPFREERLDVLHDSIEAHPFATLITMGPDGPVADHLPMLLDRDEGEFGRLRGHVARANPVWRQVDGDTDVLVIFHVADAYISPAWYASKYEHGRVVPTWNYAVVHAFGRMRVIQDTDWLRTIVGDLTIAHEKPRPDPWSVDDAPDEYIRQQLRAIVGLEIVLTRLDGKWKASQNKNAADREGVMGGIREENPGRETPIEDLVAPVRKAP